MNTLLFLHCALPALFVSSEEIQYLLKGQKLTGSGGSSIWNTVVSSLSADGNTVTIGRALHDGVNGVKSGLVQVYAYDGSQWLKKGNDFDVENAGNKSGIAVSSSSDGNIIAIRSRNGKDSYKIDSGYVRVFSYDGTQWNQMGANINGESAGDLFGRIVSISSNGHIIAIGAVINDGNGNKWTCASILLRWNSMG